jgi:hypothetical protein
VPRAYGMYKAYEGMEVRKNKGKEMKNRKMQYKIK